MHIYVCFYIIFLYTIFVGVNGYPDTQLVSYGEMQAAASSVAEGLSSAALELGNTNQQQQQQQQQQPIPCIADGDTGYGNAVNVKRTVFGYARAGMAGIMIEDQVSPKRCGHVAGKSVVPFAQAVQRVKAACDARCVQQQPCIVVKEEQSSRVWSFLASTI
jgi:isocitrate lyase